MQKDIQKSKGEQKFSQQSSSDKPSVTETTGHKLKEVGHDINAGLKENVGVGVGNYSSMEDRKESAKQGQKFEKKKEQLKGKANEATEQVQDTTEALGHKVQEIAHDVNATLKQNVGIGIGNYSSEEDKKYSKEHKEKYEEKIKPVKEQVEKKTDEIKSTFEQKKEELKENFEEKKEDLKEKAYEGQTGLYTHRIQEVGHNLNAKMKETIGVGVGDYSSEEDRKKAEEHWEGYQEKVKESSNTEVPESSSIVHKIKEVAHNVNANLKEMIGVGVGNYSSEVDRELSQIHHQKYEEKSGSTNNTNEPESNDKLENFMTSENLSPPTPSKDFDKNKDKLEEKLFPKAESKESGDTPKKESSEVGTGKKFDESDFPKL